MACQYLFLKRASTVMASIVESLERTKKDQKWCPEDNSMEAVLTALLCTNCPEVGNSGPETRNPDQDFDPTNQLVKTTWCGLLLSSRELPPGDVRRRDTHWNTPGETWRCR